MILTNLVRQSQLLSLLMVAVAIAANSVRLSPPAKASRPTFVLEDVVPAGFAGWRVVDNRGVQVVNPQAQQLLDKLYSQVLTRLYVHTDGYSMMLSAAYGDDQSGGLQAHFPELCYPAQGFAVTDRSRAAITTADGLLEVKRMEAQQGARVEPVTYWFKIGDKTLTGISSFDWRVQQLRFALSGNTPDGLLFRVSSIDDQRDRAFRRQDQFVTDLLAAVGPSGRAHLVGVLPR